MAIARLRRSLEPKLKQRGLELDDVLPVLEQVDSIAELQAALDDPESLLLMLEQVSSSAAYSMAAALAIA
eukprot:5493626-Prymnesium_polylepis.1